jgi:hypothetical protein
LRGVSKTPRGTFSNSGFFFPEDFLDTLFSAPLAPYPIFFPFLREKRESIRADKILGKRQ